MDGVEVRNFVGVWITVLATLCYCHTMAKFIPRGTTRLFAILPITCLFIYLPLHLTTIHLGSTTAFFIAWLANSKLLLFAFGKGPLSSHPPLPRRRFLLFSCLPIKAPHPQAPPENSEKAAENTKYPSPQSSEKSHKSPLNYATKISLLGVIVQIYKYKEFVHPQIMMVLYGFLIYFTLELFLVMVAALARAAAHLELEPQFDEPLLATSLQDFWGKRWNLMVTSILRPTVYNPVRSIFASWMGKEWAQLPAIVATFLVSGVMHELIFFYAGRLKPTWEVTCFFLLHGVCLALEILVKKALNGKFRLPPVVSGAATFGFVVVTGLWLFFPPVLRFEADVKAKEETIAIVEFVKDVLRVSNVWIFQCNQWIGNTFVTNMIN